MNFNIFKKKVVVKSFAEQLADVKNIFQSSYNQAIALNKSISDDTAAKRIEIQNIESQIEFNSKIAADNEKYISKLGELLSEV